MHRQARSDAELKQQIALQLRIAPPGGRQTSRNEVSYDNGKFVVTYALPGARAFAAPDCPRSWFCFYENINFGYPRGRLSSCYEHTNYNPGANSYVGDAANDKAAFVYRYC